MGHTDSLEVDTYKHAQLSFDKGAKVEGLVLEQLEVHWQKINLNLILMLYSKMDHVNRKAIKL
jgi:hypothetical protein